MDEDTIVANLRPSHIEEPATQNDMDAWWTMAERAMRLREAGKPVSVDDFMDAGNEPLQCECGNLFYAVSDYVCSTCREALDA